MSKGDGAALLRKSRIYEAATAELDEHGIPHSVEWGGKHPKLVFVLAGRVIKYPFAGSPSDLKRAALNTASDVRRMIREAERPPPDIAAATPGRALSLAAAPAPASSKSHGKDQTMQDIVPTLDVPSGFSTSLSIGIHFSGDGFRVKDVELGERLGLQRPDRIRSNIIERNISELRRFGDVVRAEDNIPMPNGGHRRGAVYYLNEEQALAVCQLSRTPRAADVRAMLIHAFKAWRDMTERASSSTPASQDIIDRIDRLDARMGRMEGYLPDIAASLELTMERVIDFSRQLAAPRPPSLVEQIAAGDYVTALEVVETMAEVPAKKRYQGLTAWVTGRLLTASAHAGVVSKRVNVFPGEKWIFPKRVAANWLANGGRTALWKRVEAHWERKSDQRSLRLIGGRTNENAAAS